MVWETGKVGEGSNDRIVLRCNKGEKTKDGFKCTHSAGRKEAKRLKTCIFFSYVKEETRH
jgi:hypothetical protein